MRASTSSTSSCYMDVNVRIKEIKGKNESGVREKPYANDSFK
jgi:hypothetical protein